MSGRESASADTQVAEAKRLCGRLEIAIDRLAERMAVTTTPVDLGRRVDSIIRARHRRRQLFPTGWFFDPAWDILLALLADELGGRRTSVSSACVASGSPAATALRHIAKLVDDGGVLREPDAKDPRRSWVRLTPAVRDLLVAHLESLNDAEISGV